MRCGLPGMSHQPGWSCSHKECAGSLEINKQPEVPTAANLLNQVCYSNKDYLMAGMICAGWDERNGGKVFSVPLGGGIFPHPFVLGGSGSGYIYGYVDSNYRKGMSKQVAYLRRPMQSTVQC